ncbi:MULTISPECIES: isocitrate lyase/PEP mutase family protein [unclassified Rathayibacter]|jgi:2-methylisocitrate lyase-like PEP mutase family enzyme|uniref:isocitrate lyase/PEP mutase family protein n=1 Tax=unclassified Rathayibacter TaxID=2609250 RepID=UPI000CE7C759|nr:MULTISPECIES: isocitrate lyase/PEP mutase family protein [unclassified Rathayibacter]PPG17433.1 carboxyphosphonoenolpyruvate phosphonomutase [Rathayibacter sp. AY1C6]PPH86286.1 carboxyphosphonoenolpyruvate phosphonomutase [Rathayibacter sp. AY1D5]PPI08282.1 carboxyphosphonoenolpyruvate phosphonomutase [Rathayibacter sp. AY1B8]PPI40249.1 carboxyphosphonoenolpyruvate phosphonomutase [Rathayibacter sp. RFBD1]PPI51427.1 carboxyphosphonoenolpyruvate phosphonomutase [Rathayibacter sp. TRS19]
MTATRTLRELMESGSVLAPCVFDCSSARAVELAGFEAMLLSGSEVSMSMKGIPDLGLLSLEELLWAVERIVDMSPLPLAVDIEDGFGASPLQVYETCRRVAKAGAMAVLMEDEFEPGYARDVSADNMIPREEYYAKVRAAVRAVEGTDCMVIARSNYGSANLEEGIQRMIDCVALGAHATVVVNVTTLADAAEVARRVPGLKMFADINAKRGLEQMSFAQLAELGFQLVTMHFTMKASMAGMIEAGRANLAEMGNTYSNELMPEEYPGHSGMAFFAAQELLDLESEFSGRVQSFNDPRTVHAAPAG